jgi:hypothetical protein
VPRTLTGAARKTHGARGSAGAFRYLHMKQAGGLLIMKVQKEVTALEERQERQARYGLWPLPDRRTVT